MRNSEFWCPALPDKIQTILPRHVRGTKIFNHPRPKGTGLGRPGGMIPGQPPWAAAPVRAQAAEGGVEVPLGCRLVVGNLLRSR